MNNHVIFQMGIVFNIVMILFNIMSMVLNLKGDFIDWYLSKGGGLFIFGSVWILLVFIMAVNE